MAQQRVRGAEVLRPREVVVAANVAPIIGIMVATVVVVAAGTVWLQIGAADGEQANLHVAVVR